MSKIICNLLGAPQILKDGRPVFMPYVKMSAFLYYILVNKKVSRAEIAGLLWPEENEQIARKNLRNAIYRLHQTLGDEVILSPTKSVLILNEAADIELDVDRFCSEPRNYLSLYCGDFLQGFSLKDAGEYENWIMHMRSFYEKKFVTGCYEKIELNLENEQYETVEDDIHSLIAIDEYDERGFQLLMRYYQKTGRNSKAIETYNDFSCLLHRELGIDPDEETKRIYSQSLNLMNLDEDAESSQKETFFYGRYNELALLQRTLQDFKDKKAGKAIVISGELGIGKSAFRDRLMEDVGDNMLLLEIPCFQEERSLQLCLWSRLVDSLETQLRNENCPLPKGWEMLFGNLPHDFRERAPGENAERTARARIALLSESIRVVTKALDLLSEKRQILLIFDDIQWVDEESARALAPVLFETDPLRVTLMATVSREYNRAAEDFATALQQRGRLTHIALERFDFQVCSRFIRENLPERDPGEELIEWIYHETEGNPFFLQEYVSMIRTGKKETLNAAMIEKLKGNFLYLTDEETEVLYAAALFYAKAEKTLLLALTGYRDAELERTVNGLKRRYILQEENVNGEIGYTFTHIKLREYCYQAQPQETRRSNHRKLGELLENALAGKKISTKLCEELAYYFSASGEHYKSFKYRLEMLKHNLNISHEMFPLISHSETGTEQTQYTPRAQIEEQFQTLEDQIGVLDNSGIDPAKIDELNIDFFYLRGRHYIREGEYEKGMDDIAYVIERAQKTKKNEYMLEGYKQMSLCFLQTGDGENMKKYVELALLLAARSNNLSEVAICGRLKGLYCMMTGDYKQAKKLLKSSIEALTVTDELSELHAANIAAAYDYLGEIDLAEGKNEAALALFEKAISLCAGKNVSSSLSPFYIDAGRAAYEMGDVTGAKAYFDKASALYGEFDSFWRRPVLESYIALILIEEKQYHRARQTLVSAQEGVGYIKSPSDLGTVYCVKAIVRKKMEDDQRLDRVFSRLLKEDASAYYKWAREHLNPYTDTCELRILKKFWSAR